VPGVDVRIDDRPASRGQLLVRTPARAIGVVLPRGAEPPTPSSGEWLETGDLAEIEADGHLRIGGRLGDTLVLATGVKVPARMGLVVVSRRHAVRHPRVVAWLARRLARRQAGLPKSWRVHDLVIADRPFDATRGETTASLKPRRATIERAFGDRIRHADRGPERRRERSAENAMQRRRGSWIADALWNGGDGGFAAAADRAAMPIAGRIEAVLERTEMEIARLRATGVLYEPLAGEHLRAPLADAPPPPFGVFSAEAERVFGEAGLWGLAVPEPHGGAGGTMLELVHAVTRLASIVPTAAGMLAVHSSIGAVSALVGFGSAEQRTRLFPALAAGRPLSIFGATEPDAGCDLARVATRLDDIDGRLLLSGTKMFITGATHGRLVKLLAVRGGKPVVVLARLPAADSEVFELRRYPLHPLRHAHNAALVFRGLEIDPRDVLDPGGDGDAMRIVWHGLNRGRVTLAAQAAGTLRLLAAQARDHAARRFTWGKPIASRQLIRSRLGRIAAATVACDALAAWAATAIDDGQSGEWEAITAKVLASHCVRDAAIDALGVHGGRAFLVGHPLGDSLHDHFAVSVYEGESDLLGLALFKGLARQHPLAGLRDVGAWRRGAAWLAWRTSTAARGGGADAGILDRRLRGHARRARRDLGRLALAIDRAIRRHGRSLADRQVEVGFLSAAVREAASVLAVAHHADASGDEAILAPADAWCRLALARAAGRLPGPDALAAAADVTLGDPGR